LPENVTRLKSNRTNNTVFISALLLSVGYMAFGFGGSVLMPVKLASINGMSVYAMNNALSAMGTMIALPLVGKFSQIMGKKTLALLGVIIQLAGRFVVIFSDAPMLLVVSHCISSLGGGLYLSLPFSLIADTSEPADRPKKYGILATFQSIGSLIGPLMAGQFAGAGLIGLGYLSYAPISIIGVIILIAAYPREKREKTADQFDFGGILLLVLGIGGFVLWLSLGGQMFKWLSLPSAVLLIIGIAGLFALVVREHKHPNPSVPVNMFTKKRFCVAFLCMMLLSALATSVSGFGIVYAQQIMQVSTQLSSTVTMPMTFAQTVFSVVVGFILGKNFAKRFRFLAIIALVFAVIASCLLFVLKPDSPIALLYVSSFVGGISFSISMSSFIPFFQTGLQPQEIAAAQGMYSFGSMGGACIFGALSGLIMNLGLSLNYVFLMSLIWCAVALVIGLFGFTFTKQELDAAS
jgi:MFS family permease